MKQTESKIQKLQNQKEQLEVQLQELMRERNEFIGDVLNALPTHSIPTEMIIGLLVETITDFNNKTLDEKQKEAWQKAGDTFCKTFRKKTNQKSSQRSTKSKPKQSGTDSKRNHKSNQDFPLHSESNFKKDQNQQQEAS